MHWGSAILNVIEHQTILPPTMKLLTMAVLTGLQIYHVPLKPGLLALLSTPGPSALLLDRLPLATTQGTLYW